MTRTIEKNIKEYTLAKTRFATHRVNSIDVLRGLVMVIMALDHTRDFFHVGAYTGNPLDVATTTPILFFTRWITHYCAPIFVFLSGTSIYLQGFRKSKRELSLFLVKRGIWLIFIELFVMSFAFSFDTHYTYVVFQVIWSIGISMVLLSLLIRLPLKVIFAIGLVIVLGHNLLDFVEAKHQGSFGFLWDLLHKGNFVIYKLWDNHNLILLYPFVPWSGLMLLGYSLGKLYIPAVDPKYRRKVLSYLGIGLIAFFVLLRAINLYGDPDHWSTQKEGFRTFLSFMNVHKYPPSLLFMCMTIGPGLLLLAYFEKVANGFTRILSVYGRVPFFYYVLHFYLIHTLCMVLFL